MTDSPVRVATPLDGIADDFVDTIASLSPMTATDIGVPGDPRESTTSPRGSRSLHRRAPGHPAPRRGRAAG
ncbi:hypothetical protein G7085_10470 [Tessaracoccus sp. HDW20]|uniref:hypothetical protein n=1 Tax=Tessaracoccus coleopterorum TaxID=2714950 RepID=UPI0018D47EED|nr:hypothetical protein [Tessaracoccus coleopterorum]NHB84886.1 hypothetical protein [Tessaracoccus coleopterorum]